MGGVRKGMEALHGRLPHILVWEYSINDHAVSLEAASRAQGASLAADTMRYMLDYWLRRTLAPAGSAGGGGGGGGGGGDGDCRSLLVIVGCRLANDGPEC